MPGAMCAWKERLILLKMVLIMLFLVQEACFMPNFKVWKCFSFTLPSHAGSYIHIIVKLFLAMFALGDLQKVLELTQAKICVF